MKKWLVFLVALTLANTSLSVYLVNNPPVPINQNSTVVYKGPEGPKGEIGTEGLRGLQGLPGFPGTQGMQGIQGVVGVDGKDGRDGEKGDKGDTGEQGTQGEPGPTSVPEFRCNTVSKLLEYQVVGDSLWKRILNSAPCGETSVTI